MTSDTPSGASVDVVICGGGFAGLTLARQVQREHPDLSVAVIDRLARPLPEGAFKVGESTVEMAAYYLRDVLGLAEYLDGAHLRKLGLRLFFPQPEGTTTFAERPEIGLSKFATVPSYQIDRGRFEHDLRGLIEEDGARMIEGARLDEVEMGENGAPHRVFYYGDDSPERQSLTARWVVDASGRRRLLQRQLNLGTQREADHNAVWFRIEGLLDVDDLVPAENRAWHDRVPDGKRRFSTNHLVDTGYWVWIIPLSSNKTSIGIVALKDMHPFDDFRNLERAQDWLRRKEPAFAEKLAQHEVLDFGAIRNYSHSSKQVFSADRWACTGDAAVFADPLYSPGADLIAFANCSISWMIGEEIAGRLTPEVAEEKSRFVISMSELLTRSIQVNYHIMGCPQAMGGKLFWDITAGWSVVQPLMFGKTFLDNAKRDAVRAASRNFFFLSLQMNQLFSDWAKQSRGHVGFEFIDYFVVDAIREMRDRNLVPDKPVEELVADQQENMRLLEELAQALFRIAVADVHPEHAHKLEGKWLNAWAISLDPAKWDERGLFTPRSAPRDISRVSVPLNKAFRVRELQH
ncbi:hypothetical protein LCGC14_1205260 [marine sediment metagenome]|uniref:FAD-binding domain-containing protein n=1 Tax=marine sediment metagenome TaxID=412755 RepID=A0A0F9M331_9ZZZZ